LLPPTKITSSHSKRAGLTLLGVSGDTLSYMVSPGGDLIFHFSPMYIQLLSRLIYATPLSIRAVSFFMVVGMLLYSFVLQLKLMSV
jgi:hypothetical protein